MTRAELRRRYIVTTPDEVSDILKEAFMQDDERKTRFPEMGFITFFSVLNGHKRSDVLEAWDKYEDYHKELNYFEPALPYPEVE